MPLFPELFAILRTNARRGPFWQILHGSVSNQLYEVVSDEDEPISSVSLDLLDDSRPFVVHEARFRLNERGEQNIIKFWYVPIQLYSLGQQIHVLDFEYKSWLPYSHHRIPVTNIDEVKLRYKAAYNKFRNYNYSPLSVSDFSSLPIRPPTPPRQRRASESESDTQSVSSTESVLTVLQNESALLVQHHEAFEYRERPLRLPESVGTLLLKQAWSGEESCPISAIPFQEIQSLSVTSCFHVFNTESLQQWQQTKNECPVCRCPIINVITQEKN